MGVEEISDEDFNDFFRKFETPKKSGIDKHMMARYIWSTMNEDPFAASWIINY